MSDEQPPAIKPPPVQVPTREREHQTEHGTARSRLFKHPKVL